MYFITYLDQCKDGRCHGNPEKEVSDSSDLHLEREINRQCF